MDTCTCTETPFKTPANRQGNREQNRYKLTNFKTLGIDGIRVIRETCTDTPFKTPDVDGTSVIREKDKAIEKTNKSISFKTYDGWVKARTANCDMLLNDALSFISEKKSAIDGEKDS